MTTSGESDSEEECKGETVETLGTASPSQKTLESEPIQKNSVVDCNHCVDSGMESAESNTKLERDPTGNDDTHAS